MVKSKKAQLQELLKNLKKIQKKYLFFTLENGIYKGGAPPNIVSRKKSEKNTYTEDEFREIEKSDKYNIIVFKVIGRKKNNDLTKDID